MQTSCSATARIAPGPEAERLCLLLMMLLACCAKAPSLKQQNIMTITEHNQGTQSTGQNRKTLPVCSA